MIRNLAFILPFLAASPALAASSQWQTSEGGSVRIVTSGLPDDDGRLHGALDIKLKPGWKTYWRNPGPSGIPPSIDLSRSPHIKSAELAFPAPVRVHDGDTQWAGYKQSVRLPVTFTLDRADVVTLIDVDVFLGICETICIPFQASFSFDPGSGADDQSDAFAVQMAHAALPSPATGTFGVNAVSRSGSMLTLDANLPQDTSNPELFIDHEKSHLFGTPTLVKQGSGTAEFAVEIHEASDDGLAESSLRYTLVANGRSVSGAIDIP
ncbi:protein-disulfide reductase DsbD domain-containing protein [Nitratireductor pacificus]|uniref:Thiol:disulfide interchange protein DsbD N-terminal domain-containing protein n=1 Tax=Nitratireductor pacificus pht-3B TaxID=391937 RepID=K2LQ45_9HYPH|nr:protein-disulfide reductase DsbD domain-containing protein [Nitratireductor pacificus]EKF19864.1 hypothetical protein NA2_05968 [Nitratireductor pacificus pht-3B]